MLRRKDHTNKHRRGARARAAFNLARNLARAVAAAPLLFAFVAHSPDDAAAQKRKNSAAREVRPASLRAGVPQDVLLRIVRAEDERRWDEKDLGALLADKRASVRARAALASGRIGDERAVARLVALARADADARVRSAAAFALGEIESHAGADVLLAIARNGKTAEERGRALEALGKIAAALPAAQEARRSSLGEALLAALDSERKASRPNRDVVLLGITAALRSRHTDAGARIAPFLSSADARVRADAANALARLRSKESGARLRASLTSDPDPVVRANAARALGAAEDSASSDALAARAIEDPDSRVRVSSIRALAQLKKAKHAEALVRRGASLLSSYETAKASGRAARPSELNEMLEIVAALGRLLPGSNDEGALKLIRRIRLSENFSAPEAEIAFAQIAPTLYMSEQPFDALDGMSNAQARRRAGLASWRSYSALAQGLNEIASATSASGGNAVVALKADAQMLLISLLNDRETPPLATPDMMRALASFKAGDLAPLMRAKLEAEDVMARAAAADILAELAPDAKTESALVAALPRALSEKMNDAALSILSALARQRTPAAVAAVRSALEDPDYVVRRRAVALLKDLGASEPRDEETVAVRHKDADYARALSRIGKTVRARVETDKGAFTIELLPEDAPLNVDNFAELSRAGFFKDVTFHRVVPNFVIQGGDPRGDGNGGPGYQIRCEINYLPYERGAVGMALSGKDTGGSQWFVTHSPQPHLDGGYTVFGRVVEGMDVVDAIARGDAIRSVTITETARRPAARRSR